MLAELRDLRVSEDLQDKALISIVEAFTAGARRQPADALRHARAALAHKDALGISNESLRWAWPLAARAAHDLNDTASARELIGQLDARPPGQLGPMLRAELDLARARLADRSGDPGAGPALTAAINRQREDSTPYHLAYGLLDQAEYYLRHQNADAAADALAEARAIARQLGCAPLLERAAAIEPVTPPQRSPTA